MAKKGEFKNYRKCNICNEDIPLTREFFRRMNARGDCFDGTCRVCRERIGHNKNWKDGLLLCSVCKSYLPEEEFSINRSTRYRNDREKRCRKCKTIETANRRKNREGDYAIERIITERFLGARDRAIRNNMEFNINKQFLFDKLIEQDYKCAISGIYLTYIMGNGRIPTNLSIDKIDSTKGYTTDNTQLVCMAVNQMKSDMTTEQLIMFCKKIIEYNEHSYQEKESWEIYSIC